MTIARNQLCSVEVENQEARLDTLFEREQALAIADLLESNLFELVGRQPGPYRLRIVTRGAKLSFQISTEDHFPIVSHFLSCTPFRRVMKDYALICEAHLRAAATWNAHRIEAIDMGRRAVHDAGADILRERLSAWIRMDHETARRLFTLIAGPSLGRVATGGHAYLPRAC